MIKKLTIREAAEKLGVTRQQIDKWLAAGRIPYVTLENGARMIEARYLRAKPKPATRGPKPKG